jgi:MFS family permease
MATEATVAQAYIADITTEVDRAGGMGLVGGANGAGFIVGPAIGGLLRTRNRIRSQSIAAVVS